MASRERVVITPEPIDFARVRYAGDLQNERVVLRVNTDTNIMYYLVAGVMAEEPDASEVVDLNRDFYWFPNLVVEAKSLVVLYTKKGINRVRVNTNGTTVHLFYWGKDKPVWTDDTDTVALIKLSDWNFHSVRK